MSRQFALASAVVLALLVPASARADKPASKKSPVLAHVKLSGDLDERAPAESDLFGTVASESFKDKIDRLKKAASDKEVSALLLEVDGVAVGWGKVHELTQ